MECIASVFIQYRESSLLCNENSLNQIRNDTSKLLDKDEGKSEPTASIISDQPSEQLYRSLYKKEYEKIHKSRFPCLDALLEIN